MARAVVRDLAVTPVPNTRRKVLYQVNWCTNLGRAANALVPQSEQVKDWFILKV
jgi:hypothetical protein